MNKEQFINALRARLDYLPPEETEKFIAFYAESIDDRVEDGMDEYEAVSAMGGIDEAVHAIEAELPLSTIVKQRVKSSRERYGRSQSGAGGGGAGGGGGAAWIVLAVIGSPIWLTLLCVLGAVVIAVYAVAFALVVVLFAVLLAFGISALFMLIYGISRLALAGFFAALMCMGMAMAMGGLAAALVGPCVWLSKQFVKLPVRFWRWVKGLFISRGRNDV